MGLFDNIIQDNHYSFSATLETNRGCPYTCAYCDWGIYKGKLRNFPMERIKAEIDWFAEHKIDLLFGADSNFGILERDEEITDYMLYKHRETGYPRSFRTSYAKNTGERIYRITNLLNQEGMCKGATLSFQSLSPETLDIIGRKNIRLDTFKTLLDQYHQSDIPTYSELIMGLPGETLASFSHGVAELLNNGQHDSLNIYLCELLTNSMMGQKEFMDKHNILTRRTPLNQYHCAPDDNDVQEYSVVVVGNKSMTVDEWKECYLFSWTVQTFHCLGLTRFVAIYLHSEYNISYDVFYKELLEFLGENETYTGGIQLKSVKEILNRFLKNSEHNSLVAYNSLFGNILWPTEEESYLEILQDISNFYQIFKLFLKRFNFNDSLSEELLRYSILRIKKPFDSIHNDKFHYDFSDYFKKNLAGKITSLNKIDHSISIIPQTSYNDWPDFAKRVVWWGRKGGSTLYEEGRGEIKILK